MKRYDLAVIGAGAGGLTAALAARRRGAQVALIEKRKIGGECTHTGCVPSKSFLAAAKLYHAMNRAEAFGLPQPAGDARFDFARVMERVERIVQNIYQHEQPRRFQDLGMDVYVHPTGAKFQNAREIAIGAEIIQAEFSIVCTGSAPFLLPGMDETIPFLHNENFWDLRAQPRSIVFLGGGVIAIELGQALAHLGTQVTILEMQTRILESVDAEISALVTAEFAREGIHVLTNTQVQGCRRDGSNGIQVTVAQQGEQKELMAETVFVALGRKPNVTGLQLERAGVAYTSQGIRTNEFLQTTATNIYACGDVTSPAKFSHMAAYQAEICVENICAGNHAMHDWTMVPWAIFSEPEIARVGLTETQARQKHANIVALRMDTSAVDRFVTESKPTGFLKVVLDENQFILGADAIGAHAGEWVQWITFAMRNKLSIQSFADTIFIYPTFSEIVRKLFVTYLREKRARV